MDLEQNKTLFPIKSMGVARIFVLCANCGQRESPLGNIHVKDRKYTCLRPSSSGSGYEPRIQVDESIPNFNYDYSWGGYNNAV